jgi:hypothetical protein
MGRGAGGFGRKEASDLNTMASCTVESGTFHRPLCGSPGGEPMLSGRRTPVKLAFPRRFRLAQRVNTPCPH